MKKSVMLTVMGIGLTVAATSAFGQGHIVIGNYQGAYNGVVWGEGVARAGQGVLDAEGVVLTCWYGEGAGLSESALTAGPVLLWDLVNQGNGFPGYYAFTEIILPQWNQGDIYTFQIRASGEGPFGRVVESMSRSALWEESNINAITDPPTPANQSVASIGLAVVVPEPSTFALVGLGSAALMFFRRRQS